MIGAFMINQSHLARANALIDTILRQGWFDFWPFSSSLNGTSLV
jgi:hypothetical protein